MANEGWIKLYRQMQDSPLWCDEKFTKGQAWVDLLLLANHRDRKILFNNDMITIKRGQYLTSIVKLAKKWQWNRKTVSSYLNMLQKQKMITKVSDNTKTIITIENYEIYQSVDEIVGQPITQPNGQPIGQPRGNQTDTNKNVKNDKNIKNNNSLCKKDAQSLFEELWKLYPVKRGKGQVSDTAKMRLLKIGKEQMTRAIERYKTYVDKQNNLHYQNGSTFFNSGYVDYIDENYAPNEEKPKNQSVNNRFNNFKGRTYDMSSIEQQLLNINRE